MRAPRRSAAATGRVVVAAGSERGDGKECGGCEDETSHERHGATFRRRCGKREDGTLEEPRWGEH